MNVSSKAARAWDAETSNSWVNWWSSAACQSHYNFAVCGEAAPGSSEGCRIRLRRLLNGGKLSHGVSVGCGAGSKEIALLQDGLVDRFDLWEIAPRLAREGEDAAEKAGVGDRVTYRIGDAFAETPEGSYDLVYWDHSLHHMSDVQAALAWSVRVLRSGGVVMINDYIGANRLQFPNWQIRRANDFLRRHGLPGRLPPSSPWRRLRQWIKDPSEAPQSEDIEAAIHQQLPGAEIEHIGGAFLNMLGGAVVPLCDDESPVLKAMLEEDDQLRREGCSHFAFTLWRKS